MEAQKDHIALLHENIPEVPLEFEKIKVDLIKVLNEQERDGIAQGILAGLKEKALFSKCSGRDLNYLNTKNVL